ncbi:ATP-dependent dethiobiotin synthetase BioD [Kaistia sp. 32K]|uniref:dethiobiotin synthase n=1 Tax=Kaistia sp. 32K TaxID=2795690 RepID=UPI0019155BF1|nr:dethiobiotin synthase [Kaistia sp. 32K]BCP55299.1 ATP-dependent dethiobiotin synthetase BioD [Kaistia sp. 32K]
MTRLVVTGTDTGIGKTVFAAGLTAALGACYWKPVQAGLDEETDSETVARLGAVAPDRILTEAYRLSAPRSPHHAAAIEGIAIDVDRLTPPASERPLVIEGAGGVLVPLTSSVTFGDVFARWRLPVVLCARTALGTINHSLLSLEALRHRGVPVLGVTLIGDDEPETAQAIAGIGQVRILGRLPRLASLTAPALREAFAAAFRVDDFADAIAEVSDQAAGSVSFR